MKTRLCRRTEVLKVRILEIEIRAEDRAGQTNKAPHSTQVPQSANHLERMTLRESRHNDLTRLWSD